MFIWDFVADTVLGQIVDWIYSQVVGFLGVFFSMMGNMGGSTATGSGSGSDGFDWSDVAKEYRLWMALYHNNTPAYHYDMRHAGTLVHVRHWNRITCWQWTSPGRLDGWQGNLDIDRFYGDTAAWEAPYLPALRADNSYESPDGGSRWRHSNYAPEPAIFPLQKDWR